MNGQNFVVIYRDAVIVILSDVQHPVAIMNADYEPDER